MARAHVFVSGRVQGVYYRDSCRVKAEAVGARGWVRNLRDGRVEAVFEGPEKVVQEMVAWCHLGPPAAQVAGVDASWDEAEEGLAAFEIRPTLR